jgi:hypothetical protein
LCETAQKYSYVYSIDLTYMSSTFESKDDSWNWACEYMEESVNTAVTSEPITIEPVKVSKTQPDIIQSLEKLDLHFDDTASPKEETDDEENLRSFINAEISEQDPDRQIDVKTLFNNVKYLCNASLKTLQDISLGEEKQESAADKAIVQTDAILRYIAVLADRFSQPIIVHSKAGLTRSSYKFCEMISHCEVYPKCKGDHYVFGRLHADIQSLTNYLHTNEPAGWDIAETVRSMTTIIFVITRMAKEYQARSSISLFKSVLSNSSAMQPQDGVRKTNDGWTEVRKKPRQKSFR